MDGETLNGGVNQVVRIGRTVRRPTGAWTPAVHSLLRHLAETGFTGAPRVRGIDEEGREILDFVPGEVAHYPIPEYVRGDVALAAAGRLLRRYHDASAGFTAPDGAVWQLPAREPREVVCHGDAATYNTVFRVGLPVALIDFDAAHPGPRVWDLAYTAYRFAPLGAPGSNGEHVPVAEQARRLRLLADAYGLGPADRRALPRTVCDRLHALVAFMTERAAAGDTAFARHLADGHDALYRTDAAHVRAHEERFAEALLSGASTEPPPAAAT
ncbi:phosphotransferase enzyme family protein [Actinorugispora endophytica]|uniref:Ser/Thr protein kinase RdoA (MazF antagonist) n=1 Tax=Actinorugispora endophytica TaxID=1605990 RepID=A0A4R6V142_9ACTN|nr:aminoglycoside phosphotransferase family protein [Actinorugispora endophytica]TDQ52080.1 Ser/Thr protein kinase RdoA (MazF antagonist) [Actinorugispora endophytica]